jgi:hypothetical protein
MRRSEMERKAREKGEVRKHIKVHLNTKMSIPSGD